MQVITYRLRLQEPLLATQIMGDPNNSVSFDYIPGSLIRGMLVHRYMQQHPKLHEHEVVHDTACRRLFFTATTRYLHAYPLTRNEERSLPTPLPLLKRKGDDKEDGLEVHNAAHKDFNRAEAAGNDQLKWVGKPFCTLNEEDLTLLAPPQKRLTVHVARDPHKGRSTKKKGEIFQYEALAADQCFAGVILTEDAADAATIKAMLEGQAWLGRARSAGYGRVYIKIDEELSTSSWREVALPAPRLKADDRVTLTLLSDAILRDKQGHYALTWSKDMLDKDMLDKDMLESYLGFAIKHVDAARSFSATTISGGFNRTAQAPLAQSYSLAAGSTVSFTLAQAVDAATLARLEAQGIGERRTEGFGRIVFNWLEANVFQASIGETCDLLPPQDKPKLSANSQALARQMARRLLEAQIEQALARFVRDEVDPEKNQFPANSQLGRVRVLLRRAARTGAPLSEVLAELDAFKQAGREQFERARMQNTTLWAWLQRLLVNPSTVWQVISLPHHKWHKVAGEQAAADAALTRRVTLQVIEATLNTAARKRKQKEDAR
ncbi:type III-B CRISPR module-associated Cmr3 family protein [Candidatus Viridilinea mediisalina]|uniref:CRISPR type III-associated protein domain-containing protein n=1 Tax=Candidatus Viridilinea mediisalina TaxID=2024553 RepID=A0A2A6RGG6_9CHLR|nr:RAMP superfamily CRISPR-associated protein [Candidatus Viridilinea mediisalina]PDW01975.1 hypothetical protein CJ255_16325 [Candidatus Viridilinea mediisalina]